MITFRTLKMSGIFLSTLLAGVIGSYLWLPEYFVAHSINEYEGSSHWHLGPGTFVLLAVILTVFSLYFVLLRENLRMERKSQHERLHIKEGEYRARLAQAMQLSNIGYWLWDETRGVPVEINDQIAEIFGESEAGLFAKVSMEGNILKKIHPKDRDHYQKTVESYLLGVKQNGRSAKNLDIEYRILKATGEVCYVRSQSKPVFDETGRFTHSLGCLQNLTELTKAKAERERVADDSSRLVDTANAPIFGVDKNGRINEWNQQAATLTGYDRNEVMGRDLVTDFITDEYKEPVRDVLDKALGGEETANYEFPLYTKAGDRLDVLMNSTTRRDTQGQAVGVVGVGQDITELKKSQAQVIQSSKLASLGEMATSVAHELNQPLNTIRLASSNISDAVELGKATQSYIQTKLTRIDNQIERASAIINHMRMFGREAHENYELLDLGVVIDDTLGLIGEQLRLAGIELKVECTPGCPSVMGHRIQLEQVLINLITNARDAIKERDEFIKPKIVINCQPAGNQSLAISIEDTGGGVPERYLNSIFDPFFTTKEMGKGTGLGLSVSFGIISDMGGNLQVENIDEGAKFVVTLPITNKPKIKAKADAVAV